MELEGNLEAPLPVPVGELLEAALLEAPLLEAPMPADEKSLKNGGCFSVFNLTIGNKFTTFSNFYRETSLPVLFWLLHLASVPHVVLPTHTSHITRHWTPPLAPPGFLRFGGHGATEKPTTQFIKRVFFNNIVGNHLYSS